MKLITEKIEDVQYIAEGEGSEKKLFIEGIFLQGAIKNRNGRIYPMNVLENETNRYIKEAVEAKKGWGELSHPTGPVINPDRISHRIVSLVKEGNNYIGKALVIKENPSGAIVAGLINSGGAIGVSSRGMGSLKDTGGIMEVQSDFRIATAADVVLDPSAPDAFVRGIMEGVEWSQGPDGQWIQETVNDTKKMLSKLSLREINEQKVRAFKEFCRQLVEKR